ncbi:MAG: glycosyltransferase family 2 protein [Patescibacteria group bacterium]
MKLAVGFITYNEASAGYLADFLPSLENALHFLAEPDYQVYVFDNSPFGHDLNRRALESFNIGAASFAAPRRPLRILAEGRNLGFSRAYNILIDAAKRDQAEYFLVINPDTILEPDALEKLVAALDDQASLGSVSPKILRWDFMTGAKTTVIDSLGLTLRPGLQFFDLGQGLEDWGKFDQAAILGPSGAAGLFRLSALDRAAKVDHESGGREYFDERFFMYKEDCDLAYRLFLAGYESALVADAIIYHDRTASSSGRGLWRQIKDRFRKSRAVRSWSFKNQHLIFVKYWKEQNLTNKSLIIFRIFFMFIFALILEQFLLKQYFYIGREIKGLTNIK